MPVFCFKSLAKLLFIMAIFATGITGGPVLAQSLTHGLTPDRERNMCLRLDPEIECDRNGVISVTLHGTSPGGFSPSEMEVVSLTPGVTVQPNYMSPVQANPSFVLNGASIGQQITLMTNAVDFGAGSIAGSDLCCAGWVKFRIPRDICSQPDPDLKITKTRGRCSPWASGNGHSCKFRVNVQNVGAGSFFGPLSVTDTFTAPAATVSNPSPPWICSNFPANQSFTCDHPITTMAPGDTVVLDYTLSIPGYRRGGRFRNCAELRPNNTRRGQIAFSQTLLNDAGYGAGTVDGVMGSQTRAAIRQCQAENGMPTTGDYRDFLDFIGSQSSVDLNLSNNRDCIDVGLDPNPNKPITPKICPAGTTGTYPNCRTIAVQTCPSGTTGTFPNCRKIRVQTCPTGTTGTFPNCRKIRVQTCPTGTTGTFPNCAKILTCPRGTIGNWPICIKI
jgi:hypothetical protein